MDKYFTDGKDIVIAECRNPESIAKKNYGCYTTPENSIQYQKVAMKEPVRCLNIKIL